ncbi:methyltransferase domain-containing protein [Pedobacter montanisoli]|uniref:TPMT family class I SAM-dependent methyltransferase n=1 Tax=Pedobacter montanisoli TaxID=2923277 RepID=A0ABS9ZX08_9SPHI|nr:methyltransferase domain-containing protein [Pedobacter montanisoli]MCJ0742830.1 TPMT family class I SAM-dependent methyltransferase [Pedobacter montanisoli]
MLNQDYWQDRWQNKQTRWDIGYASPAITTYIEQYQNKNAAILIPGCGNAYEAEFLVKNGFTNITLIDIAPKAVEILKEKFSAYPTVKIICEDFFKHEGNYDLIIEQTFFCAIKSNDRKAYAQKSAELLNPEGKLIGLLFNRMFAHEGPPYGGQEVEYRNIFSPYFEIQTMELCYNSIEARKGTELFVILKKKLFFLQPKT